VELSIRGMTCASCAARVEKSLGAIDGVIASVNIATETARVTAPSSVPLGRLIEAVEHAGYEAGPARPAAGAASAGGRADPDADRVGYLRRRLIVALVFFVPLSDLSVQLSLFPAFRFPGWPWVLVALALPVAGWAAWPFHAAALRHARHGTTTMDTLVSLGIIAACGWSGYAMFVLDARPTRVSPLQLLLHASGGGIYLEVAASVTTFLLAGRWYEALAAADLGLALGSRTDVAISAADLIVLRDDLSAVPEAIGLARATLTVIRRNLAWAFGYNVAAIPLAAAGLLNPLIAGAAMAASSAFVVASSVRLRRFGAQRPPAGAGWRAAASGPRPHRVQPAPAPSGPEAS